MPILGPLLGRSLASALGHAVHWIGAALLIATGMLSVLATLGLCQAGPGSGPLRARRTSGTETC
jgi:putative Mn2+ efflux pump MntP